MQHRMAITALCAVLAAGTAAPATPTQSQEGALALGIRQAREGDFDQAVLTLDGVVRRLKAQGGSPKDLAWAHLFLAVAHLGLARQTDARTNAEAALRLHPALQVTSKEFPPRVVAFFDDVRRTVAAGNPTAATPAPVPTPTVAPSFPPQTTPAAPTAAVPATTAAMPSGLPKNGGGHKGLWIGLGAAGVGGGVAAVVLATEGASPAPSTTPAPSAQPTLTGHWNGAYSSYDNLREVLRITQTGQVLAGTSRFEDSSGTGRGGDSTLSGLATPDRNVSFELARQDGSVTFHFAGTVNDAFTVIQGTFGANLVSYWKQ